MNALRTRLAAGSRHNLGPTNQVVAEALRTPALVPELIAALTDGNPTVTHRSANALRKILQARPELVAPHAKQLLRSTIHTTDLHTRWNLTIILGQLPLRGRDRALAVDLLFEALSSSGALLRVFALQALANFAREDKALRTRIVPILQHALTDPSAAIRARARKLLPALRTPLP